MNWKKISEAPKCNFCGGSDLTDFDGSMGQCNSCGLLDCPDCDNEGGCFSCKGMIETCPECGGHGKISFEDGTVITPDIELPECKECEGTGKITCTDCDGEAVCANCERPSLVRSRAASHKIGDHSKCWIDDCDELQKRDSERRKNNIKDKWINLDKAQE